MVTKVETALDSSKACKSSFFPKEVLKICESELSNVLGDNFNI